MSTLNSSQKLELLQKLQQLKREKAINDLHFFIDNYVYTLDEHDQINPIKKFPAGKEYIHELIDLFLYEQILFIEKSRQMMVTWLMCACHLWDAQFHEGRRIFFQSKKEKDANANIDRVKFIYNHEPEFLRIDQYKANEPQSYLKLEFGKNNSIIEGTPQGADVLRQYTASRIFSDETAFQEKAEESYIAAKPTLVGGGKYICVSSPNFKEFFYRMINDLQ